MAFWTSAQLEPLRKFRFKIQYGGDSMVWWAKSVTQPSPDISISEHQLINHKIKYPGIVTWNDIDITIVDIGGKGSEQSMFLQRYPYNGLDPQEGVDGLSKKIMNEILDPLVITKINAKGESLETWKFTNAFVKSIKYGDLDYSSDDLLEITITVAYDSATLSQEV
jgi:hypothetical protein